MCITVFMESHYILLYVHLQNGKNNRKKNYVVVRDCTEKELHHFRTALKVFQVLKGFIISLRQKLFLSFTSSVYLMNHLA